MLTHLSIKNYALIESLSVNFKDKLSIITGETGAGKSILLGALGLGLGNRADASTLKDNSKKCIIEAQFSISNYELNSFFQENELDFENETIIMVPLQNPINVHLYYWTVRVDQQGQIHFRKDIYERDNPLLDKLIPAVVN